MGTLLDHLGRACHHARITAGVDQYAIATTADVSRSTIGKFETRNVSAPRALETIVLAYAAECAVPARDLWDRALDAWENDQQQT